MVVVNQYENTRYSFRSMKKKHKMLKIQETWYGNGLQKVEIFDSGGKNISKNPPVAKFISEYKERKKRLW